MMPSRGERWQSFMKRHGRGLEAVVLDVGEDQVTFYAYGSDRVMTTSVKMFVETFHPDVPMKVYRGNIRPVTPQPTEPCPYCKVDVAACPSPCGDWSCAWYNHLGKECPSEEAKRYRHRNWARRIRRTWFYIGPMVGHMMRKTSTSVAAPRKKTPRRRAAGHS